MNRKRKDRELVRQRNGNGFEKGIREQYQTKGMDTEQVNGIRERNGE